MNPYLLGFGAVGTTTILGSLASSSSRSNWYDCIRPKFAPPSWLFGPVWTLLYIMIAISFSIAIKEQDMYSIYLFIFNLVLNALWSYVYLTKKKPSLALLVILPLNISTLLIITRAKNSIVKKLLIPYFAWVTFATILNIQTIEKEKQCKNISD